MKVIVAIDGSQSSEHAIDALINMEIPPGSEIKLLIAVEPYEDAIAKSSEALQAMAAELQAKLVTHTVKFEVAQGDAKSRIIEVAKDWSADLIVMGSRVRKGLELVLIGGVSQGVLTQSPCPVVLAKAPARQNLMSAFKNILVTVDNSDYTKAALTWISTMQWRADTNFRLLTIVPLMSASFELIGDPNADALNLSRHREDLVSLANTELSKIAAELSTGLGSQNVTTKVGEGDPKDLILANAEEWPADLIVMGSHGRTGLDKLLLGSVSQAVALRAPCSVAIVTGLIAKGGKGQQRQTGMFTIPNLNG